MEAEVLDPGHGVGPRSFHWGDDKLNSGVEGCRHDNKHEERGGRSGTAASHWYPPRHFGSIYQTGGPRQHCPPPELPHPCMQKKHPATGLILLRQ